MKRKALIVTALVIMVMMATSSLVGCASASQTTAPSASLTTTPEPTQEATTAATTPEPTKALDAVTLRFYFGGDKPSACDAVWQAVSDKFKDKLNAKFEINYIGWADYQNKLSVMSASGDNWDANFDGDWLAFPVLGAKGAYLGLNDLLPKYAPTLYAKLKEQNELSAVTSNGKIIAIPWTMSMNVRPFVKWRSDLAKQANLNFTADSVKTIEDLTALYDALHKAYPDKKVTLNTPLSLLELRDNYWELPNGYVYSMNDPKCTVIPVESLPLYKEAAQIAKDWYDKGYIPSDAMVDKTDGNSYWNNGVLLTQLTTHEWISVPLSFTWTDPSWTIDSSLMYPDNKFYNRTPTANIFCINKNAVNPERALMFSELMETNKDFYDSVMYGIQGTTYVLNGETADFPQGMTAQTSNYLNWTGQWCFWKPQFMRPTAQYPSGFWKTEADFAKQPNNVANPLDGLFLNGDNIKDVLSRRTQIMTELGKPLSYGVVDNVDKAVSDITAQLKAAGSDAITADYQKQVDAFLAQSK